MRSEKRIVFKLKIPTIGEGDPMYAAEKYMQAVEYELSRGDGSDFEHLEQAFEFLIRVSSRDLPEDLRDDHESIIRAMTASSDQSRGNIRAAIQEMTRDAAKALVGRIHAIEAELSGRMRAGTLVLNP